jgi:4-hydroxy-3-methylbut-2-enyl diphosphate reductase IspH
LGSWNRLVFPTLLTPLLLSFQDFGFCWGVERSIALAYEAVEHYPGKTLHITNELIHNPEVNDRLTEMKVNLIEKTTTKDNAFGKDFSTIKDGDVVILPAFGASYEEMAMLHEKVRLALRYGDGCCGGWFHISSISLLWTDIL